ADEQIETGRRVWKLLGVRLLEPDGGAARGSLAACLDEHRRREVDRGHAVAARGKLEREKPGPASDVERVERAPGGDDEIEDPIPRPSFRSGADAVAEVLVELRRPSFPVGRDLLLDDVVFARAHARSAPFDVLPRTARRSGFAGGRCLRVATRRP